MLLEASLRVCFHRNDILAPLRCCCETEFKWAQRAGVNGRGVWAKKSVCPVRVVLIVCGSKRS